MTINCNTPIQAPAIQVTIAHLQAAHHAGIRGHAKITTAQALFTDSQWDYQTFDDNSLAIQENIQYNL